MIFCHNIHLEAEYLQFAIIRARISICRPSQNLSPNLKSNENLKNLNYVPSGA